VTHASSPSGLFHGTARDGWQRADTVVLWIWRIDPKASWPRDLLSPEEAARAARFVRPEHRVAHEAAHAGLRAILGAALGLPPAGLGFGAAPQGKPFLAAPAGTGLQFNLSHSAGLAALGLARFPIGVDIEAMRQVEDDLAASVFSAAEQAELASLPPPLRQAGFFRGWTRKEAVLKALGSGLLAPLDRFTVSLAPGAPARLLDIAWAPGTASRWQIAHLEVGSRHLGAVAAERTGWRLALAAPAMIQALGLSPPEG
jgi:4'-phosphopantetheinyl transferase